MSCRVWLQAPLVLALLAGGCRQITGIEDRHAAPAPSCKIVTQSEACTVCTQSSCCKEIADCAVDATCKDRFTCLASCRGDDASTGVEVCRGNCSLPGIGTDDDSALAGCQATHCAEACGLRCGGVLGSHFAQFVGSSNSCLDCAEQEKCTAAEVCAKSPACMRAMGCGAACPQYSVDCRSHCYLGLDSANYAAYAAVREVRSVCAPECGAGSSWDCTAPWPASATGDPISLAFEFRDFALGTVVPDVQVQACKALDSDCAITLLDGAVSAANGIAKVTVPSSLTGFDGYFAFRKPGYTEAFLVKQPNPVFPADQPTIDYLLVKAGTLEALVNLVNPSGATPRDPNLGMLAIEIVDCHGLSGVGIRYEFSRLPTTVSSYLQGSNPLPDASATAAGTSLMAAYNVKLGWLDVDAYLVSTSERVAWGRVPVSANRIGHLQLVPRKAP